MSALSSHQNLADDHKPSEISKSTPSKAKLSRSQSRRARRRKAQKKQQMDPVTEDGEGPLPPSPKASSKTGDPEILNGPVTYELPLRGVKQGQDRREKEGTQGGQSDEMKKKDGLKLRLELDLDIELELKASIRGNVTLALL